MKESYIKHINPAFSDDRGSITDILDDVSINHTGIITSKKGTVRANHYHLKQDQYNYIISGEVKLTLWAPDNDKTKKDFILKEGDIVYIPAMIAHRMEFLEDTLFIDLNTESRSNNGYETDTVRIEKDKSNT